MGSRRAVVLVLTLVAASAVWGVAVAGSSESAALDWRHAHVVTGGSLSLPYPGGWYATTYGGNDVVVASFPLTREWVTAERKSLPRRGVYIWAFSYSPIPPASDDLFVPRPATLQLDPKTFAFYSCGFNLEAYAIHFREQGLAVQVMVALGPDADPRAALAVVNRLRVA
jgi:hypothetical protein